MTKCHIIFTEFVNEFVLQAVVALQSLAIVLLSTVCVLQCLKYIFLKSFLAPHNIYWINFHDTSPTKMLVKGHTGA